VKAIFVVGRIDAGRWVTDWNEQESLCDPLILPKLACSAMKTGSLDQS